MTAQSPGSYTVSVALHASVVVLIVLFTFLRSQQASPPTVKIMEMVAGAGTNWQETVAPRLGSRTSVRLDLPKEAPTPTPPAATAPQPVPEAALVPAPDTPAIPPAPKAKAAPQTPDLVKTLSQTEARRERNIERKYQAAKAAAEKREAEARRVQALKDARAAASAKYTPLDVKGIAEGVTGGSVENDRGGASGKALSREMGDAMNAYWSELKTQVTANFVQPDGVSDRLMPRVEFYVAADGTISRVRIIRSSGSADFDRAVLDAFAKIRGGIGPRPDKQGAMGSADIKVHDEDGN